MEIIKTAKPFYKGAKREKTLFDKRSSYQNQQALHENSG
jgi:hypothetical protein